MKRTILVGMIALMAIAGLASAQQAPPQPPSPGQAREACAADVQTLCPNTQPGRERRQCMMANMGKLSEGCRTAMGAMRAEARGMRAACAGDSRQYCPGQQGPAAMQCLRQNQARLSTGCQSALGGMEPPGVR